MFLGIELVDQELHPHAEKTACMVNRMKEFEILMSSDGPDHNVIKIKPPLTFRNEDIHKAAVYFIKLIFKSIVFLKFGNYCFTFVLPK